jgi:peroxiredoxin
MSTLKIGDEAPAFEAVDQDGNPILLKKNSEKYVLPFPLISDKDKKILKAYRVWGKKKLYGKEYDGILRTGFRTEI